MAISDGTWHINISTPTCSGVTSVPLGLISFNSHSANHSRSGVFTHIILGWIMSNMIIMTSCCDQSRLEYFLHFILFFIFSLAAEGKRSLITLWDYDPSILLINILLPLKYFFFYFRTTLFVQLLIVE
jgi:hypothetical protein